MAAPPGLEQRGVCLFGDEFALPAAAGPNFGPGFRGVNVPGGGLTLRATNRKPCSLVEPMLVLECRPCKERCRVTPGSAPGSGTGLKDRMGPDGCGDGLGERFGVAPVFTLPLPVRGVAGPEDL